MNIRITHNDIVNMVAEALNRLDSRSVLLEITTQDAYTRFYQGKIPEKVFQKLMLGSDQMTPLHKLALDHLVKLYAEQAKLKEPKIVGIISKFWNSANNESRQYAIKVCKDEGDSLKNNLGFFENVITELSNMKSHSEGSYIERGFEVLFEDDDLRVTCTKSYSSSCRHYGKSHWCTASDQFGEYDGFSMFRRYTVVSKSVLVQFVIKKDIELSCQAQINATGRTSFGQICTWEDIQIDKKKLDSRLTDYCGQSLEDICKDYILPNLKRMFKETVEIVKDEKIYYDRKKAERLKTITKKFINNLNSKECENFAKQVFTTDAHGSVFSENNVWRGYRLRGCINPNFVTMSYEGRTQAERDLIERYYDDEDYFVDTYGKAISSNIVFLFDNNGEVVGKYIGELSLCNKFFTFITDTYSDTLYGCEATVLNTNNGQILFNNVATCATDNCDTYLEDLGEDTLKKLFDESFHYGEWFIVSDANNNAYALNSQNGQIVKIPYVGYYF